MNEIENFFETLVDNAQESFLNMILFISILVLTGIGILITAVGSLFLNVYVWFHLHWVLALGINLITVILVLSTFAWFEVKK